MEPWGSTGSGCDVHQWMLYSIGVLSWPTGCACHLQCWPWRSSTPAHAWAGLCRSVPIVFFGGMLLSCAWPVDVNRRLAYGRTSVTTQLHQADAAAATAEANRAGDLPPPETFVLQSACAECPNQVINIGSSMIQQEHPYRCYFCNRCATSLARRPNTGRPEAHFGCFPHSDCK